MIAGGRENLAKRPIIPFITSFAISPLKLCTQSTLIMQEANRQKIPVALSSAPMAGATAPLTNDEIIGNCCRVLKGLDVDGDHLALEVIDAVGPGGNFMTSPHTMKYMRSEYYGGNGVSDRKSRNRWEKDGAQDTRQRALAMAKQLISNPRPEPIAKEVVSEIRKKFESIR